MRFFEEAALVARGAPADVVADVVAGVVAYGAAVRRIEEITNEYYRQIAVHEEDYRAFRAQVDGQLRAVWKTLSPAKYDRAKAEAELARRFGAHMIFGETGGFQDMHYGHVVVDRTLPVEQQIRAAVRSLDPMARPRTAAR